MLDSNFPELAWSCRRRFLYAYSYKNIDDKLQFNHANVLNVLQNRTKWMLNATLVTEFYCCE